MSIHRITETSIDSQNNGHMGKTVKKIVETANKMIKHGRGSQKISVAEPEPMELKLFGDLEPEPEINFNKHFLRSVWRMLG